MRPRCLGANLMSVTDVRESTKLVRFTQWLWAGCSWESENEKWLFHVVDVIAQEVSYHSCCMELFSWRRWTTGLAQQSNVYVMLPCMCCIIFLVCHKHNSLPPGPNFLLKISMAAAFSFRVCIFPTEGTLSQLIHYLNRLSNIFLYLLWKLWSSN